MTSLDWEDLEAADRIAKLSDEVMLTTKEAALFLRVSVRSMERMRSATYAGTGPDYHQAAMPGMRGLNQSVRYRLGDLRAWLAENRLGSTLEAAIRKGQV
jgi:hypothetical protein